MILLSNRNRSSGLNKLDLHGLHEKEALEALKNRLSPEQIAYVKNMYWDGDKLLECFLIFHF